MSGMISCRFSLWRASLIKLLKVYFSKKDLFETMILINYLNYLSFPYEIIAYINLLLYWILMWRMGGWILNFIHFTSRKSRCNRSNLLKIWYFNIPLQLNYRESSYPFVKLRVRKFFWILESWLIIIYGELWTAKMLTYTAKSIQILLFKNL